VLVCIHRIDGNIGVRTSVLERAVTGISLALPCASETDRVRSR